MTCTWPDSFIFGAVNAVKQSTIIMVLGKARTGYVLLVIFLLQTNDRCTRYAEGSEIPSSPGYGNVSHTTTESELLALVHAIMGTATPVPHTSPAIVPGMSSPTTTPTQTSTGPGPDKISTTSTRLTPTRMATPATITVTQGSTTQESKVCHDKIDTCSQYGRTPCINKVYEAWSKYHCALYCGFCTPDVPKTCLDKVPNCPEYDDGTLCTTQSYYSWAYENCKKYCKFDTCNDTVCEDKSGFDCQALDDALNLCADKQKAKTVCRNYCDLCSLVDGAWSSWESWGDCHVTCGNGTRTRARKCDDPKPADGGLYCEGPTYQNEHCQRPVCPVHGNWGSWSAWGTCSVSCDVGMQRRDRHCDSPYPDRQGDHCFGTPIEYKICMPGACADGQWSEWEEWSNCSNECGGVRVRERNCSDPEPSFLGKQCIGNNVETGPCTCAVPSFTVTDLASGITSGTVTFSKILFSEGNDFNSTSGIFTCSVPGIYHFTASLSKIRSTSTYYYAYCYLRLNGSNKVYINIRPRDSSNSAYGGYSASASVVFHLELDDEVNLGGCTNASHFQSLESVFTGFLIKADEEL